MSCYGKVLPAIKTFKETSAKIPDVIRDKIELRFTFIPDDTVDPGVQLSLLCPALTLVCLSQRERNSVSSHMAYHCKHPWPVPFGVSHSIWQITAGFVFAIIIIMSMMYNPNAWALYLIFGYFEPGQVYYPNPGRTWCLPCWSSSRFLMFWYSLHLQNQSPWQCKAAILSSRALTVATQGSWLCWMLESELCLFDYARCSEWSRMASLSDQHVGAADMTVL